MANKKGILAALSAGAVTGVAVATGLWRTRRLQNEARATGKHVPFGPYEAVVKRPLDVVVSAVSLVVLSPIIGATAVAVRAKLGSPVIFSQTRPGLNGELFEIYKFRTMTDERDSETGELLSDEERLTGFGKWLRSTSLDELPELFNILKGDMALIGPRPLMESYLPLYNEEQAHRHDVRPGMTGLAQVRGRNGLSWEDKFDSDIEYVRSISVAKDAIIFAKTFRALASREGISSEYSVTMEAFKGTESSAKKSISVCIVTPRTPNIRLFREDLVRTLVGYGHKVTVLGEESEDEWLDYFSSLGAGYRQYCLERTGTNPLEDLNTLRDLTHIMSDIRPTVVFNYFAKPNIYGAIAARMSGVPYVYDSVEGLGSILSPQTSVKGVLLRNLLMLEYKNALKRVDKCFFVNEDNMAFFIDNGLVSPEKVFKVNGVGVNLETYPFSAFPGGKPTFLFCGRLIRDKGIELFLEAARLLKRRGLDADFIVVGGLDSNPSSIAFEELETYVDDGSVVYCGEVSDVVPYYQRCWIYCSPSFGEGLPKTGMEAMSVGRGLVMTDCPGNRDLVEEGDDGNGLLVPCGDVEALADALEFCALNRETCLKWGLRSRALAEDLYDVRKVNSILLSEMGISSSEL